MARIPEIERRLLNWARWLSGPRIGGGGMGGERVDGQGWDAPTVIPTNDAEAAETDRAVASLEPRLQASVIAVYTGSGDIASKARRAGIATSTLFAHVDLAHKCLARWFADQHAAAEAERKRVEALRSSGAAPAHHFGSELAPLLAKRRAGGFTE